MREIALAKCGRAPSRDRLIRNRGTDSLTEAHTLQSIAKFEEKGSAAHRKSQRVRNRRSHRPGLPKPSLKLTLARR
jgi:hypothetical protein